MSEKLKGMDSPVKQENGLTGSSLIGVDNDTILEQPL